MEAEYWESIRARRPTRDFHFLRRRPAMCGGTPECQKGRNASPKQRKRRACASLRLAMTCASRSGEAMASNEQCANSLDALRFCLPCGHFDFAKYKRHYNPASICFLVTARGCFPAGPERSMRIATHFAGLRGLPGLSKTSGERKRGSPFARSSFPAAG